MGDKKVRVNTHIHIVSGGAAAAVVNYGLARWLAV